VGRHDGGDDAAGSRTMVLLYARVVRKPESDPGTPRVRIAAFASSYLAVWILFSLFAVFLQFGLERIGVMSTMVNLSPAHLAAGFLIAAGLYQLTPLAHGAYCLGCCAVLMLLLFVGGVMNLVWIAGLALLVAVEKLAPFGAVLARAMGAMLMVGGAALLAAAP
jgi:predicted metal-binding membrane protein